MVQHPLSTACQDEYVWLAAAKPAAFLDRALRVFVRSA
jgi:hypothetical protein